MNLEKLKEAKLEAERFLKRVEELQNTESKWNGYNFPIQSGAVKRSSMDLTRSLAKLRKSD